LTPPPLPPKPTALMKYSAIDVDNYWDSVRMNAKKERDLIYFI